MRCGWWLITRSVPPARPEVSLSPEDAAEAEQILAVFDEYMTVYVELAKTGASGDRDEALARLDKTPVAGLAEVSPHHDVLESNHEDGVVARRRAGLVRPAGERELEVPASFDPVKRHTPRDDSRVCRRDQLVEGGRGDRRRGQRARWPLPPHRRGRMGGR